MPVIVITASLLAGLLSLDLTAAVQLMVCRPLVAGTLLGMLLGEPGAGFSTGCLIELIWLGNIPVGSVIPPDFTLGTCFAVATGIYCHQADPGLSWETCIFWALLCSLPVASLAGAFEQVQRRWHNRLLEKVERLLDDGHEPAISEAITLSLLVTFVRGALLVALSTVAAMQPMARALSQMLLPAREALGWMYWLSLLLGFVVLIDQFWERRWLRPAGFSFFFSAIALYAFDVRGSVVLSIAGAVGIVMAIRDESISRKDMGREAA